MSQQNVRVVRTRTLLRQALIEAIEERGFDRITVGELTTRAMVSRAAFYRNYRDKYELVEQIFDEAMTEMTAGDPDAERSPEQRWAGFFAHIDRYHRLYAALLGRKGSPWFTDRMRTTLAAMSSAHLPGQSATDFVPGIVGAMFVQSIVWWLDNGRPCPPEQMAAESARLIRAVLGTASGGGGW
ncbi:TetR family transcriptional regulator [Nocardia sp. 852002-20019_SCH5090214]|jgi:AcrR family transcriptional regulator|uniref:TetR/AcrR family transcriptional regulator n=1 Tax=Nocardia nova TaxID=37330 RepID=A0A2S5ZW33_9NOCA|nr:MULTISPECIES: TetR/AcrR family transcriptional regulator [Nocardia]OBF70249.1 TetR family transcriptional regulator [Mycobacterium sp. 852002-51759_SCH5129042]MBF6145508.1 TetR/AcrR family transcriptional regulator [Nocardia nova]MBF6277279.1 TetR/AcrR family transcriptional regulator [Nocardia nova]MDN2497919.1 TetR/AcrR family transcriptional regulator [Nocardia nova]OBA49298.1 TetR family transcriptional regulator [Nocardia sp. 852002-51101_SCH5132738]